MRVLFFPGLALFAGLTSAAIGQDSAVATEKAAGGKLVWSDEFNEQLGNLPDSSKWTIVTGGGGFGNHELKSYTDRPENVQQRDGNLVITARKESYTGTGKIQQ